MSEQETPDTQADEVPVDGTTAGATEPQDSAEAGGTTELEATRPEPRRRRRGGSATSDENGGGQPPASGRARTRPVARNPFAVEDGPVQDPPENDATSEDTADDEVSDDTAADVADSATAASVERSGKGARSGADVSDDGAATDETESETNEADDTAEEDKPRRRRRRGRRGRGGRNRAEGGVVDGQGDATTGHGGGSDKDVDDDVAAATDGRATEDDQAGAADRDTSTSAQDRDVQARDGKARDGKARDGKAQDGKARDAKAGGAKADGGKAGAGKAGVSKGSRSKADDANADEGKADDAKDDAKDGDAEADGTRAGRGKAGAGKNNGDKSGRARDGAAKDGAPKDGDASGKAGGDSRVDDQDGDDQDGDTQDGDDQDGGSGSGRRRRRGRRGRGRRGRSSESKATESKTDDDSAAPTRLSARNKASGGRRRVPSVSPETRRVMAESPPKRMLVTVGAERTQIAVLEERTLVEHYVTQAQEQSYVGNIYKGRVQNVLPGMEAAFVDIGKGRNGVLYAGEVNYDEADIDGNLPRIEQALKSGQEVLVQVTKDPMGTKGARLTQHLSLAGRYCVLAPSDDMLGISRKLPDDQRERLRKILKGLKPDGFGLIVRTAAENATAEQLQADVERLLQRWARVEEKAAAVKPLESIYAEPQLVLRVIRDVFGPEHTQLIIDDADLAQEVRDYLGEVSPEHVDKVVTYEAPVSDDGAVQKLFNAYEVTTQIRRALEKKVWLKSGGYLIIEKTEAMWVIDVNTGKFVGKDNLEETVLRNNIEAAEEIARQLRLRDMGGIIVIDFVDMIVPANREEVLKRFKRELARDKTKSRVMEISKLGLVQMTRKNVSKGLMEAFTEETDDVIPGRRIVEDLLA